MKKMIVGMTALATLGFPGLAAEANAMTTPTVPEGPPPVDATACVTESHGWPIACAAVHRNGDGHADATVCTYDGVFALFGWADGSELACVETTDDWGFIAGSGVCERTLNTERPQVCVNGRNDCLLWVMGVQFVCWA